MELIKEENHLFVRPFEHLSNLSQLLKKRMAKI